MLTVNHHAIPSQTLLEVDETTEQFISVFIFNIFINKSSHNKDIICYNLLFGIRVENHSEESKIFWSWKYTFNLVFRIGQNNTKASVIWRSDLFPDLKIGVIMPVDQLSGKVPFGIMKLKSFTKRALKWLIPLFNWHFVSNLSKPAAFLFFNNLRWLDTVFQGQYLPSLNINYVAKNKVLEKLPPQLY